MRGRCTPAIVALAAVAAVLPACRQSPPRESSFARDLDELKLDRRLTESRLWGATRYAPWAGSDRGARSRPVPTVIAASARAQQEYLDGKGTLGDYGLAVALGGDLDEGIEALESATRGSARQAEWLTDVATLYLERNRPADVVRALDAAARANEIGSASCR